MLLSFQYKKSSGFRKHTLQQKFVIGDVTFSLFAIIFLVSLSLLYLTQSNQIATLGYEVKDLEIRKQQLETQSSLLKMQVAQLESLTDLKQRDIVAHMPPVNTPIYVKGS